MHVILRKQLTIEEVQILLKFVGKGIFTIEIQDYDPLKQLYQTLIISKKEFELEVLELLDRIKDATKQVS